MPLDHVSFSNKNSAQASSSLLLHQASPIGPMEAQFKIGPVMVTANEGSTMVPISPCLVLMEHYLKQAKFEEANQPLFLALGAFKCPVNVPYPSPPQCFLSSAFKYAPAHNSWPPTLSAQHKADLAQASYSEEEILTLDRFWASLCARCLQWGHKKINAKHGLFAFTARHLITR